MPTDLHHIYFIYAPIILIILLVIRFINYTSKFWWVIELVLLGCIAIVPTALLATGAYGGSHITLHSPLTSVLCIYGINLIIAYVCKPDKLWRNITVRRVVGVLLLMSRVWPLYLAYLNIIMMHK